MGMNTVTMRNVMTDTLVGAGYGELEGRQVRNIVHEAVDHVPDEMLDEYLADARTRWAEVTVTKEE